MKKLVLLIIIISSFSQLKAQEGIPIYHDYLSDNLYLLHPSMAGAPYCAKVRMTGRMQWFGLEDAPMLQTLSFNTHLGQNSRTGIGGIIFNDRNGYHSQKGIQLAFAYHLDFSNGGDFNKLSFGIAGTYVQNQLDETSFDPNRFDPIIAGIIQSENYFNLDFGFSYHVENFFLNMSVKNALLMDRQLYTAYEPQNVRNFVGSIGYFFGKNDFHVEPSFLVQYKDYNGQLIVDQNLKFYFDVSQLNQVYFGASYRRDFSDSPYEAYHNITPIIGARIGKYVLAYTYTYELGNRPVANSGFHQLTLGYNFNCTHPIGRNKCPELN